MMATITQETHIELSKHESLTLGRLRGHVVKCLAGEIWLTVDGEGRDVVISAGGRQAIASDGLVVASAFEPSIVSLRSSPHRSALAPMLHEKNFFAH